MSRIAVSAHASLGRFSGLLLLVLAAGCTQQTAPFFLRQPTVAAPEAAATPALLPAAGAESTAATPIAPSTAVAGLSAPSALAMVAVPAAAPTAPAANGARAQAPAPGNALALPGIQFVSPEPGTSFNPAGTAITIRYGDPLEAGDLDGRVTVSGTQSGTHGGRVVIADDGKTAIFNPNQPFSQGEKVSVHLDAWGSHPALDFSFVTDGSDNKPGSTTGQLVPQNSDPNGAHDTGVSERYATLPADFPTITAMAPATGTAEGLIFASNFQLYPGPSGYYLMILDNNGDPVFYQKLAADSRVLDFKPLSSNILAYADDAAGEYILLDNSYRQIGTVKPGNGYKWFDEHDLQLLPDGHYLLMANEVRNLDLTGLMPRGTSNVAVTSQVVQELDRGGNVVFQWRALDHMNIADTTESIITGTLDFSHSNSLALDNDGNLLLSSRHLDEITKIDRQTGNIIWRLGGKNNQFEFSLGPGVQGPVEFYHQHDARQLPNGHLTLFDNHNAKNPTVSRALEYVLDESAKTATLVWSFVSNPPPYAIAMGNVQRLPNGNTLIGWGTNELPNISEVKPDGSPALQLDFGGSNVSYRAFRYPWQGYPTWPPALAGQLEGDSLALRFSWNGATDVARYRILGGNTENPDQVVGEQPKAGFETSATIADAAHAFCYYQVVPVDTAGKTGVPSAVLKNPACTG